MTAYDPQGLRSSRLRIAIARQVEGFGLVICLNAIPVGWPAALILACLMPRGLRHER
jgi:hypothetical protein